MTFASGKVCGSRERVVSSSDGARGTRERRGYVYSTAHGTWERRYLLCATCVGGENEWGPVLLVRTRVEKDRRMSVPLRTEVETHHIC